MGKSTLTGVGFALLSFAIFSSHDVLVKMLGGRYQPFQIIFFSVLLTFPLVTLMTLADRVERNFLPVHPYWSALRTIAAVTTAFCAFFAFSRLPLAQTYAIFFASPFLITMISIPILKEKVGIHRWAAIIIGFCGVLVVLRPGTTTLEAGHYAAIVAAFGHALASVIVRKIGREERTVVLMIYPMILNFAIMSAFLPFVYKPMPLSDFGMVGAISALAFAAGLLMIAAYRTADAAIVAPMQYSQIIWAAIFGAMFFGETMDFRTVIGVGIIVLSGLYVVLRETFSDASPNRPVSRTKSRVDTGIMPRVSSLLRMRKPRG